MSKRSFIGRPETHGLKVITGDRLRRTRFLLCMGGTKHDIATTIFKISAKTMKRYMVRDDARSRLLVRAIEEGEALRDEPLGELICYLLDRRDEAVSEMAKFHYQLPNNEDEVDLDALEVSEDDEDEYMKCRDEFTHYDNRLRKALIDNHELTKYKKSGMLVRYGKTEIIGLIDIQRERLENGPSVMDMLKDADV